MVLVWKDELEGQKVISSHESIELTESYVLIADKLKKKSSKKILSIFRDDNGLIQTRLGASDQYKFKGAERGAYTQDGEPFVASTKKDEGWIHWVLLLHRELLISGSGKYLVGLVGLILIFLISSGALILPYFKGLKGKKQFRFKVSILHQKIGVFTLSWLVLITFTGVFLALNSVLIGVFLKSTLSSQRTAISKEIVVVEHDLKSVLEKAKKKASGYEIDFISYPDNEFSLPGTYALLMESKNDKKIAFIKSNAELETSVVSLPWYLKALIISEPLHFGNYGGVWLKVFWTIFGLLVGVIPFTGLMNYYLRKW